MARRRMPRPRRFGSKTLAPTPHTTRLDRNEAFVLCKLATYMERVQSRYPSLDDESLGFFFWILGPEMENIAQQARRSLSPGSEHMEEELRYGENCGCHIRHWPLTCAFYG